MSVRKEFKIIIVLIFTMIFTRKYYEIYRLFCFFLPVFIYFLYSELKPYYSIHSIVRFTDKFKWHKNLISIIIEYAFLGAIVLCIDKVFITNGYNEAIDMAPLFLVYLLVLSISGMVLILPKLSVIREFVFFMIIFILSRCKIKMFYFLQALYDSRKWCIDNGIVTTIIIFIIINIIIYSVYFICIKTRTEIMEFYEK